MLESDCQKSQSGREDSNLRPLGPKTMTAYDARFLEHETNCQGAGRPLPGGQFYRRQLEVMERTLWQKIVRGEAAARRRNPNATITWASNSPITDDNMVYAHFGSRGLYAMDMQGNLK
jgi:hypothetical protein